MVDAKRSLLRLQPILLAVGFALLIGISVATALLVDRASTDSKLLADTLAMQDKLSDLLLSVRRAESSQRGYLFTSNTAYLDDFREAHPEAKKLVEEVQAMAKGRPGLATMLKPLDELVEAKFSEMADTILLNQNGNREAARAEVLGGKGRELMASIRDLVTKAVRSEGRLAAEHSAQTHRTDQWLLIVALTGAGLIFVIGGISILLVQRNTRQAEAARAELAGTNANLERIVAYRTEDLTEANEEIQRFAYIVSHDLRSPLVNVMGFTSELEALRKDIFDEVEKLSAELAKLKAQSDAAEGSEGAAEEVAIAQLGTDFDEAIGFIKSSIANMDRLINAVLKLSREGRREFTPEAIEMDALLRSIVESVAHRAAEQGASIRVGEAPGLQSDRLAVQQVFSNLLDNALKYGRADEPLHVDIEGRVSGLNVVYDVKDNGRGIDPRDHQRVFELFRRSGQQDRPGEGIGLAFVRATVRRLGGNMSLASELGKGSTFTVTLPQRWSADRRRFA
ncbi:MAG TPA: CHASE3 domain-containing protein [Pseudolabrys sp.]|nr:CHASE3 domain-containing protein [Pseudolabrys sp.]